MWLLSSVDKWYKRTNRLTLRVTIIMRVEFESLELRDDQSYWHAGRPFKGIAVYRRTDGTIESEATFVDGVQSGSFTDFHQGGSPSCHGTIRNGVYHGELSYLDRVGKLMKREVYEYGICTMRKEYDASGNVVSEYDIPNDHPNAVLLALHRQQDVS